MGKCFTLLITEFNIPVMALTNRTENIMDIFHLAYSYYWRGNPLKFLIWQDRLGQDSVTYGSVAL